MLSNPHIFGHHMTQWKEHCHGAKQPEPAFLNLLRNPRIDSQSRPVRQPYLSYRPARLHRLAESILRNRFSGSHVYRYGLWFWEQFFSKKENQLEGLVGYLRAPECGWQLQYRPHWCSHNQPMHITSRENDNAINRFVPVLSIQIRIQHFKWINQEFWWPKLEEKNTAEFFFTFYGSKLAIYLPLGLHKGCSSYRRSLQPPKENIQHFKDYKLFSIFLGNFCPLGFWSGLWIRI